jgi:DNA-binding transcriptional LysR family regulator
MTSWDDLRYVLALSRHGSLARTAKALDVDHTTVGRRVESAEAALGVTVFARTSQGYVPTLEGERVLFDLLRVEDAVLALQRGADASKSVVEGAVRVTSPETFGATYLAPLLAGLGARYPKLALELVTTGTVLDLSRREADVAVRFFRTPHEDLVVRRVGHVAYGLYASRGYLAKRPLTRPGELREHAILTCPSGPKVVDGSWVAKLSGGARAVLVCDFTIALLEAARAGSGVAVLPRYLGDREPDLQHVPMPDEPSEPIWLTVHKDVKGTPRVRAVLDTLAEAFARDAERLAGATKARPRAATSRDTRARSRP